LTLQALWILMFSSVGRAFLIKSSFFANDTFYLMKDQIRSSRHSCKYPCIPFLPDIKHCGFETQFTRKINETFAMPSNSFDVDQPRNTSKDPLHVPNGPMNRSKIKALKEALNALILNVSTKSELKGPLEYQEETLVHLIHVWEWFWHSSVLERTESDLSKINWLRGVILLNPIVLVPWGKFPLCHTPIRPISAFRDQISILIVGCMTT